MQRIDIAGLTGAFGFGVAGNFTGHLEQAGEAVDFASVSTESAHLPKGIFPWYAPRSQTFLGQFPLSGDTLLVPPAGEAPHRIQIEPELAVACTVTLDDSGAVQALEPQWVAAFDDCSLRRPNAAKISEKKNWGEGSKGIAPTGFALSNLDRDGVAASLRLACFLKRDGETHAYGVDSAIPSYTLFGDDLVAWLIDRLNHQREAAGTPLEDVGRLLRQSQATRVLIGVGATRYEPFGETTFVEPGDEAIVVLYDSNAHDPDEVAEQVAKGADSALTSASVLRRVAQAAPI